MATFTTYTPRVTEATRLWLAQAVHYVEQARELAGERHEDYRDVSIQVILDHVLRDLARVAPDIEAELDARAEAEADAAFLRRYGPLPLTTDSLHRTLDHALA
jgi:hypothetical protein